MEPVSASASLLVTLLAWSVVLLVAHVLVQGMMATKELGTEWNAGPRDDNKQPASKLAGRAERASSNFRETYPAFVALAAGLLFTGETSGLGLTGAVVWFVGVSSTIRSIWQAFPISVRWSGLAPWVASA